MEQKQQKKTSILSKALLNGVSGCVGVACQTIGLLGVYNLKEERVRSGANTIETAARLYRTGGLVRFYQGFFSAFRSASMARFGDNFFSSFVTKEMDRNTILKRSPILFKATFVWAFASTWRLFILPIDALGHVSKRKVAVTSDSVYSQFRKTIKRIYLKRSRPEIASLYFWFTFHMYCDEFSHPMTFKDNLPLFILRNGLVGFGSMAFYDIMLGVWRKSSPSKIHLEAYSVLLGECNSRTLMKGLHGTMFCTFSNLFKLFYLKECTH